MSIGANNIGQILFPLVILWLGLELGTAIQRSPAVQKLYETRTKCPLERIIVQILFPLVILWLGLELGTAIQRSPAVQKLYETRTKCPLERIIVQIMCPLVTRYKYYSLSLIWLMHLGNNRIGT